MPKKKGKSTHDKKALEKQIAPMFDHAVEMHEAAKLAAEGERHQLLMESVNEYARILEVKEGVTFLTH
jgi:hypothetical protein